MIEMKLFNSFEEVLPAIKSGGCVAYRMEWVINGYPEFCIRVQYPTKDNDTDNPQLVLCKFPGSADSDIISGWRPGDGDLFAIDWCLCGVV